MWGAVRCHSPSPGFVLGRQAFHHCGFFLCHPKPPLQITAPSHPLFGMLDPSFPIYWNPIPNDTHWVPNAKHIKAHWDIYHLFHLIFRYRICSLPPKTSSLHPLFKYICKYVQWNLFLATYSEHYCNLCLYRQCPSYSLDVYRRSVWKPPRRGCFSTELAS